MKKIVATMVTALALALTAAAPVYAQADAASTAAARELFESMNYRSMMLGAMQQMSQGLSGSMRAGAEAAINANATMSAEEKRQALAKVEADLPNTIGKLQAVINDPTLVDDILAETIPLYARTYSADELKQITAFYRTPVGAKMLASMPKLMGEGMQIGQQVVARRIGPMMRKMQQEGQQ